MSKQCINSWFLPSLQALVFVVLVACFGAHVSTQVIAFIEKKTTRVVEKTLMKELDFPQVMFCPKAGLKSEELVAMGKAEGIPLTRDFLKPQLTPFLSNFNLTDIDEIWQNGTYQRNEFNVEWKVEDEFGLVNDSMLDSTGELLDLNMVWHGRCLVWKAKIKARKYLPQILFFIRALPEDNVYITLRYPSTTNGVDVLSVNAHKDVTIDTALYGSYNIRNLELESHEELDLERSPCNSDPNYSFDKCLMREITDQYMNKSSLGYTYNGAGGDACARAENVPCYLPQIKHLLDSEKSKLLKKCPTVWDYMCELGWLIYAWKYGPSMCPKPCKTWHYKSYDSGSTEMADHDGANTMFLMTFATDTVLKDEEHMVMDVPTIVGSVGGSLGLFLGFSCLSSAQIILKRLGRK